MMKIFEAKMNPDIHESMNSKKYAKERKRERRGCSGEGEGVVYTKIAEIKSKSN